MSAQESLLRGSYPATTGSVRRLAERVCAMTDEFSDEVVIGSECFDREGIYETVAMLEEEMTDVGWQSFQVFRDEVVSQFLRHASNPNNEELKLYLAEAVKPPILIFMAHVGHWAKTLPNLPRRERRALGELELNMTIGTKAPVLQKLDGTQATLTLDLTEIGIKNVTVNMILTLRFVLEIPGSEHLH